VPLFVRTAALSVSKNFLPAEAIFRAFTKH